MRLTIGMATYRDYDGAYFTFQALRLYHDFSKWDHVELLAVDNAPESPEGKVLQSLFGWFRGPHLTARYLPFVEATGTAAPRDRVFREASGDVVLCLDGHVLLAPGSLDALHDHYQRHPDTLDLIQGPLLYDDLTGLATHFDDVWRGEMWGVWATDPRGSGVEPFEIGAQGLGLFACRKSAWLGFNPHFEGFGGEEWYIHTKYRQAGRKAICLPRLRWLHRFGRPGGVPYKLTVKDKIRNYVLGHRELGLVLDRCREHFVGEVGIKPDEFDAIVLEVDQLLHRTRNTTPPPEVINPPAPESQRKGCGCGRKVEVQPQATQPPEPVVRQVAPLPGAVRSLLAERGTVVEFSRWRGAFFGEAMSAKVAELHSHTPGTPPALDGIDSQHGDTTIVLSHRSPAEAEPVHCHLLVIGWQLDAEGIYQALERHGQHCEERIVLVGTKERGESWEGRPGILPAARRWLAEHRDWTVLEHIKEGEGYLILSRLEEDKKPLPSTWKQAWNVLGAAWRNQSAEVLTGFGPLAGDYRQELRLAECTMCASRNGDRCGECGCPIEKKTSWAQEQCPLGKWGTVTTEGGSDA